LPQQAGNLIRNQQFSSYILTCDALDPLGPYVKNHCDLTELIYIRHLPLSSAASACNCSLPLLWLSLSGLVT
jgi:hypothetical protein